HDVHYGEHVGRTARGDQFFITTPFVPAIGGRTNREVVARYLSGADGALKEGVIHERGTRGDLIGKEQAAVLPGNLASHGHPPDAIPAQRGLLLDLLNSLGPISYQDISVKPFQLERFGVTFGLIPEEASDDDEPMYVALEPGDYMAF